LLPERASRALYTLAVRSPEVAFHDTPVPLDPCTVRDGDRKSQERCKAVHYVVDLDYSGPGHPFVRNLARPLRFLSPDHEGHCCSLHRGLAPEGMVDLGLPLLHAEDGQDPGAALPLQTAEGGRGLDLPLPHAGGEIAHGHGLPLQHADEHVVWILAEES